MCTVTWSEWGGEDCRLGQASQGGYEVFFNRDELLNRSQATEPRVEHFGSNSLLLPRDSDAGGTWLGVNQCGELLCLLNYYPALADSGDLVNSEPNEKLVSNAYRSRGTLIPELLLHPPQDPLHSLLKSMDMSAYASFTLLHFPPQRQAKVKLEPRCYQWDAVRQLYSEFVPKLPMLSSSSYLPQQIVGIREKLFQQQKPLGREQHLAYHCSHQPSKGPASVCMHRQFASSDTTNLGRTVSLSHLVLQQNQVEYRYYNGSPCELPQPSSMVTMDFQN